MNNQRPWAGLAWIVLVSATIVRSSPILLHRRASGRSVALIETVGVVFDSLLRVILILPAAGLAAALTYAILASIDAQIVGRNSTLLAGVGSATSFLIVAAMVGGRLYPPEDKLRPLRRDSQSSIRPYE